MQLIVGCQQALCGSCCIPKICQAHALAHVSCAPPAHLLCAMQRSSAKRLQQGCFHCYFSLTTASRGLRSPRGWRVCWGRCLPVAPRCWGAARDASRRSHARRTPRPARSTPGGGSSSGGRTERQCQKKSSKSFACSLRSLLAQELCKWRPGRTQQPPAACSALPGQQCWQHVAYHQPVQAQLPAALPPSHG